MLQWPTLLWQFYIYVLGVKAYGSPLQYFIHTDKWNRFVYPVNHVKQTACKPARRQRIYVVILLLLLHSLLMSCSRYVRKTEAHLGSTADTSMLLSSSGAFRIETCNTSIVADVKHVYWQRLFRFCCNAWAFNSLRTRSNLNYIYQFG